MPVTRCICREVDFRKLLARAEHLGCPVPAAELPEAEFLAAFNTLQDDTGLGTGCGTCVPYAQVALRTGRCVLPVMSQAELDRALDRSAVPVPQSGVSFAANPTG